MRILYSQQTFRQPRRRERGSAVIVVMALIAILLLYVAANLRTLDHLHHELKLLEQKQVRRLQTAHPATNQAALTVTNLPNSLVNRSSVEASPDGQNHRN